MTNNTRSANARKGHALSKDPAETAREDEALRLRRQGMTLSDISVSQGGSPTSHDRVVRRIRRAEARELQLPGSTICPCCNRPL